MTRKTWFVFLLFAALVVTLVACDGEATPTPEQTTPIVDETETPEPTVEPAETEPSEPAATEPPATTPPTPTPEGTPAHVLSDEGERIYLNQCASCHGESGEGVSAPALIGQDATLEEYATARDFFDYIQATMPRGAPGSLTEQQYLEVTAFLLVKNELLNSDTSLTMENLSSFEME
jgi:mono/diheme cytochrome c family protein